jgi:hypothetical protein
MIICTYWENHFAHTLSLAKDRIFENSNNSSFQENQDGLLKLNKLSNKLTDHTCRIIMHPSLHLQLVTLHNFNDKHQNRVF